MTSTENLGLPLFDDDESISLLDVYNPAMIAIDREFKNLTESLRAATAEAKAAKAKADETSSELGKIADDNVSLDVSKLSDAKVTASGIVYFKEQ